MLYRLFAIYFLRREILFKEQVLEELKEWAESIRPKQ